MDPRLRQALARAEEVARQLSEPATATDTAKLKSLGREHARLVPIVRAAESLVRLERELVGAQEMAASGDSEMMALADDESRRLAAQIEPIRAEIQELLVPRDPLEDRDVILEIRAGTGGDEAGLFAGELLRMYTRFSERRGL
jgi:peptide chain release factor 1